MATDENHKIKHVIKKLKNKPTLIVVLAIVLVIIAATLLLVFKHREDVASLPCTNNQQLLEKIGPQLDPSDPELLEEARMTIDDIKALNNYFNDYNCIYPAAIVSIYFGEHERAREYLNLLERLEAEGQALDQDNFEYIVGLSALEEQLTSQEYFTERFDPFGGAEILTVPLPESIEDDR